MKYILPGPPKVSFWLLVFWFLLYTLALLTKTIFILLFVFIHPQGWQRFQISKTK